jgi:hypothetical protein
MSKLQRLEAYATLLSGLAREVWKSSCRDLLVRRFSELCIMIRVETLG